MKKYVLLLSIAICMAATSTITSQAFNTTLRDQLDYTPDLNDVWGYVAADGTEYALVGLRSGLSIVSLADPDNIVEVQFIAGDNSIWRDIKTYGNYAYVVADQGNDGIVVHDLSGLPGTVTSQSFTPTVGGTALIRAHNLYIDVPTGRAYIAGANVNSGGMVIFDVATTPGQPALVATAPNTYAHDVYVQDGLMYASEINVGRLSIYDVSNPLAISQLSTTATPNNFTHNAWASASGNYVFTTDERNDAFTAAYDITDPFNPEEVDRFRPARSLGTGTIPHNVHVLNDYLIISHYTDGVEIVDASVPSNLVEVGYYDSWPGTNGGFNGSWGAYPFLPSGLVLSSDISTGLYVIEVDYKRGARIKGTVTEGSFAGPDLNGVSVTIASAEADLVATNAAGYYQNGIATAGNFTVTFSKPGYQDVVVPIDFVNGLEVVLDTFLTAAVMQVNIQANVTSTEGGAVVPGAEVLLVGENGTYAGTTDQNGQLSLNNVFVGQYEAYVGKWGFENKFQSINVQVGSNPSFQLQPGYLDGFMVDQGWIASDNGNVSSGFWVREVPNETLFGNVVSNPGTDVVGGTDIGNRAYVTGNAAVSGAGEDDVDGANVILTSPVIDFSILSGTSFEVNYDYWFFNAGGNGNPLDEMTVRLDNGITSVTLATYSLASPGTVTSAWTPASVMVNNQTIAFTNNMRIIVTTGDTGTGHLLEAGFDNFSIQPALVLPVELTTFTARATNQGSVQLDWKTEQERNNARFIIERSTDGRTFASIGQLAGAGNSDLPLSYQFTDQNPTNGTNHYRLRQLDFDGTFTLSDIRIVHLTATANVPELFVYPNPSRSQVYFNQEVVGNVLIYRADGSLVGSRQLEAGQPLDISQLANGSYWLRVGESVLSVVKQ